MKVYLTSDHGGFELKAKLAKFLQERGFEVADLGPHELDENDDYPDFALGLTNVLIGTSEHDAKGIAICRSAQGMCMAVNRTPGVRGAIVWNEEEARKSRQHNDANVLCLSADHIDDETNFKITEAWLNEQFSGDERHRRRIAKLDRIAE